MPDNYYTLKEFNKRITERLRLKKSRFPLAQRLRGLGRLWRPAIVLPTPEMGGRKPRIPFEELEQPRPRRKPLFEELEQPRPRRKRPFEELRQPRPRRK